MAGEHSVGCFHHSMQNNSFITALLLTLTMLNFFLRYSILVGVIDKRDEEQTTLRGAISRLKTQLASVQANSEGQPGKLDTVWL